MQNTASIPIRDAAADASAETDVGSMAGRGSWTSSTGMSNSGRSCPRRESTSALGLSGHSKGIFSCPAMPMTSASRVAIPSALAMSGCLMRTEFTFPILNELRYVVNRPLSTVTVSPTR